MGIIISKIYTYALRPVLYFVVVYPFWYGCKFITQVIYFIWNFKKMPDNIIDWRFHVEAVESKPHFSESTSEAYFWYLVYNTPWDAFKKRKVYRRYRATKG